MVSLGQEEKNGLSDALMAMNNWNFYSFQRYQRERGRLVEQCCLTCVQQSGHFVGQVILGKGVQECSVSITGAAIILLSNIS